MLPGQFSGGSVHVSEKLQILCPGNVIASLVGWPTYRGHVKREKHSFIVHFVSEKFEVCFPLLIVLSHRNERSNLDFGRDSSRSHFFVFVFFFFFENDIKK